MDHSGGLFYHYLALRNSLKGWQDYRESIADFLYSFSWEDCQTCIWVGVSGGYSIPKELIKARQNKDIFIDPDPIARWVFKKRNTFDGDWRSSRLFAGKDMEEMLLEAIRYWKENSVDRVILCNLLGQLSLVYSEKNDIFWQDFYEKLSKDSPVELISYHDLYTFKGSKKSLDQIQCLEIAPKLENWQDLVGFLSNSFQSLKVEVVDHNTSVLAKHSIKKCWWRKDKNSLHLIDCIYIEKK